MPSIFGVKIDFLKTARHQGDGRRLGSTGLFVARPANGRILKI
jgi:hypothetical protein